MSRTYRLALAAEEDLLAIWLYTDRRWGEEQADIYQDTLHAAFRHLADGTMTSRPFAGDDDIRFCKCEHHYLFFVEDTAGIVVIAVLHERMDLPARLAERLQGM